MRTRPVLHEAENEAKAKIYEAEATKFEVLTTRRYTNLPLPLPLPSHVWDEFIEAV